MAALNFAGEHPFVVLMLLLFCYDPIMSVVRTPALVWSRWMRHRNIVAHGWPPPHLDADGDFKPEPKAVEAEVA